MTGGMAGESEKCDTPAFSAGLNQVGSIGSKTIGYVTGMVMDFCIRVGIEKAK